MQNQNGVLTVSQTHTSIHNQSSKLSNSSFVPRDKSSAGFSTLNLTSQQLNKIAQLRQITDKWSDLQPKEKAFLNDMCLFRFDSHYNKSH